MKKSIKYILLLFIFYILEKLEKEVKVMELCMVEQKKNPSSLTQVSLF